eukprot:6492607-Amphidinium_carterae.3
MALVTIGFELLWGALEPTAGFTLEVGQWLAFWLYGPLPACSCPLAVARLPSHKLSVLADVLARIIAYSTYPLKLLSHTMVIPWTP